MTRKKADWWGPVPGCFEEASELDEYGTGPAIHLYQEIVFGFPVDKFKEPYWAVRDVAKAISYCPFCGAKLPEVELAPKPKGKIYTLAYDGDYCGTCDERSMACNCRPPAARYRIKTA